MKLIPLTQGRFAQVDDEDYHSLIAYKWHLSKRGNTFYAARTPIVDWKKKAVYMHNQIIGVLKVGEEIDHKDRDGLNNQKSNLRIGTHIQNLCNRKTWGRSKYNGVNWYSRLNNWRAQIKTSEGRKTIGYFKTEEEAALAYNEAAKKHHGEFAKLNVIN